MHLRDYHVQTQKRSVQRETRDEPGLSEESAMQLVDRLVASGTSPSRQAIRSELRKRVREALDAMAAKDREILVLWYLEQLSIGEIAALLQLSAAGVKSRHRRALTRLSAILNKSGE